MIDPPNFSPKADERAISNNLHLVHASGQQLRFVERFTRIDADTIDYQEIGPTSWPARGEMQPTAVNPNRSEVGEGHECVDCRW